MIAGPPEVQSLPLAASYGWTEKEYEPWKDPFIVLGTFMVTTAAALKGFGEGEEGMLGVPFLRIGTRVR
jgi:hypothetical protein